MRPDVDRRPFNLTPRHLHSTSQDKKKDSFENTLDSTATTSTSTVNTVSSTSASTSTDISQGSLRKRSLPRSNLEPDYQQERQLGEKIDSDDPFAFTTTEPFSNKNNDQINTRSTNSSTMFSSRQKYSPLPNPNGTSSSGGKRRGGSSLSPLKKMIIIGGVVILLFVGLMGGKHVTRSTPAEEGGLEGYEEGEWAGGKGDMGDYEFKSPPFLPEGVLSPEDKLNYEGDEVNPQEDGEGEEEEEEMFHILPVPHGNGHKNDAGKEGEDKWSAEDIAELDGQEMDEPGQTNDNDGDADVQVDKAAQKEHDSDAGLTAPEEMTPSRGPDSFESDKDATSTEFCEEPHDETLKLVQYAIVIDAGSTGSRIHVYKFNNCGPTPALEYETFKAIQPGLSSFARDPTAAAASLDPLMKEALRVVPESLQKCTPVEVKATAGLRLLPGREGEAILEEVRVRLESDYPFAVSKDDHAIEIMDGKDEGVYAWITANYLLGKIGAGSPDAETMAVMDLGGASTQIVFEPTFPDKETKLADGDHKYDLSFGGKDYTLYQHSYLGYGLMRARRSVHNLVAFTWSFLQPGGAAGVEWDDLAENVEVPNPCLGKGMTRRVELDPAGRKSVNVTMVGAESSFESCKRVVELVLAKDAICEVKPCSFNGVYQPSILDTFPNGQLLALSYFTDRIQPLLAPYASMPKHYKSDDSDSEEPISAEVDVSDTKTLSVKTLALMAKDVCAGPATWKRRWGHDKEAMAELEGRPEYCLDLTFMHGLLGLGYELTEKRELVVEKKLRGVELGWALGAGIALVEKATLTCTA